MSEIKERIEQIIAGITEKKVENLDNNVNLFEDLDFDSILILQLVSELEEEWNFTLADYPELLDEMETIESLVLFLEGISERNAQ